MRDCSLPFLESSLALLEEVPYLTRTVSVCLLRATLQELPLLVICTPADLTTRLGVTSAQGCLSIACRVSIKPGGACWRTAGEGEF